MAVDTLVTPFYADWKFWSFVVSISAIVLSQLPPVLQWFKPRRLSIEVFSNIHLTHKFGNPNCQLHLLIANTGGRKLRITALNLNFTTAGGQSFVLPAANFFQKQTDKDTTLFTSFSLLPGEEWGHIVTFFPYLTRQDDKLVKGLISRLRNNIIVKRKALSSPAEDVRADDNFVVPFVDLLNKQFKWKADEYEMVVSVMTQPLARIPDQRYRFTIFESDEDDMRSVAEGYVFGYDIIVEAQNNPGLFVRLQDAKNSVEPR